MKTFMIAAAVSMLGTVATAQDATTYPYDGSFEDATFSVENAIIGNG